MSDLILEKLSLIEHLLNRQFILQKTILSLEEVCEYLNVSSSYIYKLTSTKQIPHYSPTGKKLYFKRSEIDSWLLTNKNSSAMDIEMEASNYLVRHKSRF